MNNILKTTSALLLGAVMITGTGTANAKAVKKINTLPSYKIGAHITIPQLKLDKNTLVSDYKYVDINGDKVKDNVILTGVKENKSDMYISNINIVLQDGKTKKFTKTPVGNGGYDANMFLGDFNGDKRPDVLVSMPTGGSGGMVEHGLVSFNGTTSKTLFDSKKFNEGLDLEVKFLNDFKAEIKNKELNKTEIVDLSKAKDSYIEQGVYDKDGKLKENIIGMANRFSELKSVDVDKNGTYELLGYQRVCGTCNADTIGYVVSTWKWDGKNMKLDADDVKFERDITYTEADVNGDGTKDYIRLAGMKSFASESPYMTDINLSVYDGKINETKEIPVENVNEGYVPKLVISDFNGDKSQDMLISVANGGSAGTSRYSLISYKGNKITNLLDANKFNYGLKFDVEFKDGFKADVIIKDLNKTYSLDINDNKDLYTPYEIYSKDGKLLKQTEGMMNAVSEVKTIDVDKDGNYEIVAYQRVCGTSNAETLGYVKSTWNVENSGVKLVDVNVTKNVEDK